MLRAITTLGLAALLTACVDHATDGPIDIDGGLGAWDDTAEIDAFDRLFECPAAVESPADVAALAAALDDDDLTGLFESLRETAMARVDPACVVDCSPSGERECAEASCETRAGDAIEYSRTREVRGADGPDGERSEAVEIAETIAIAPAVDSVSWSRLELRRRGLVVTGSDGARERWELDAAWEGILTEDWPADSRIAGETREWSSGDDWSAIAEWSHERCRVVVGTGDDLLRRAGAQTRVAVAGHRVETRPQSADNERLDGWVDGECVGEIDPATWEVVGPCPSAGNGEPTDPPTARRRDWDKGSFPIRRCSAHHCVALKDISCLRGSVGRD